MSLLEALRSVAGDAEPEEREATLTRRAPLEERESPSLAPPAASARADISAVIVMPSAAAMAIAIAFAAAFAFGDMGAVPPRSSAGEAETEDPSPCDLLSPVSRRESRSLRCTSRLWSRAALDSYFSL